MGRKYTIELEEKPFFNEKGNALYRVKGFRSLVFDEQGIEKLAPYTELDLTKLREDAFSSGYARAGEDARKRYIGEKQEAYQKGLDDAWEAAKKIVLSTEDGGLFDDDVRKSVFGCGNYMVLKRYSASEAIEKIRQHEQEDAEFHIGDEFVTKNNKDFGVIVAANARRVLVLWKDDADILDENNRWFTTKWAKERFAKTGRNFPEIAKVFKKMKRDSNDTD